MRSVLLSELMRRYNSLADASPATTAKRPLPISCFAEASTSRRIFVLRFPASGPWQAKQRSERIGRLSRLNSIAESGRLSRTKKVKRSIQLDSIAWDVTVNGMRAHRCPHVVLWNAVFTSGGVHGIDPVRFVPTGIFSVNFRKWPNPFISDKHVLRLGIPGILHLWSVLMTVSAYHGWFRLTWVSAV